MILIKDKKQQFKVNSMLRKPLRAENSSNILHVRLVTLLGCSILKNKKTKDKKLESKEHPNSPLQCYFFLRLPIIIYQIFHN